jgi:anaerobic magnesium-protoporphyrin IX monomethyl ester cyclase
MKLLFVNAIDPTVEVETRYPSLGPASMAAVLRRRFTASAIDMRIVDHDVESMLREFKPAIVCISAVTQNFGIAGRYASMAKKRGVPVVVGGVHVSALPLTMGDSMDVGCIGEGEETIVELFSLFMKNGDLPADDLASINAISFHDGASIRVNPPRELIRDLDSIPFPARDLIDVGPHSYMFTSRGCPYRCRFCSSSNFWRKPRFFSAEYVLREIEELVENYGVRLISFFDDLFIGDKARLSKIALMIEGNERLDNVSFTCSGRANLITDETAALLKRMRVRSVGLGLESGSEKTLRYLKVNNISVSDNRNAVLTLRSHGIAANASFIIGAPEETENEMLETFRFIKRTPISLFDTYVLTPYPGTELWDYARTKGLVSDAMDWSRLNVNFYRNWAHAVTLSTTMDSKELLKMYNKFGRLRLLKNMLHVWSTPQLSDLGAYMVKRMREYLQRKRRTT